MAGASAQTQRGLFFFFDATHRAAPRRSVAGCSGAVVSSPFFFVSPAASGIAFYPEAGHNIFGHKGFYDTHSSTITLLVCFTFHFIPISASGCSATAR
jgi:hypothetical protein